MLRTSIFSRYLFLLLPLVLVCLFCVGQAGATERYTVQSGDTLWGLARTWGVGVDTIKGTNSLAGDNLKVGQTLNIPEHGTSVSQPVSRGGFRNVVSMAQNFLGIPYVSAGSSPRGFDCSGFTQYVYSLAGVRLPRVAASQFSIGTSISRNALSSGDLVFFSRGAGISHVGIYIGNGNFIHASSSRGVAFDSLNSSYWMNKYVGARRILN